MIVIAAPVVGPILGAIFRITTLVLDFLYQHSSRPFLRSHSLVHDEHEKLLQKKPRPTMEALFLSIGVAALQIFLDKGQNWDWWNSHLIQLLAAATIVAFTYLFIREFWHKTPFIELRLFKIPSFTLSIICLIVSYGIYFGTVVLVPLWLQEFMNYSAEKAGLAVAALGIAPVCLSLTTPLLIKRFGNAPALALSFVFFGVACFYSAFFTTEVDLFHIALARFIFGFGFVYYISPLFGISTQDVPAKDLPSAMGIFHFFRSMVGGVGTSVFTTLWIRRTYFHHERIGASLTRFNPFTPPASDQKSLALLNNALDQQAAMLAINETFYLMGWIFTALVVLLALWLLYQKNSSRFVGKKAYDAPAP